MQTTAENLVAVNEQITTAGAIVWWRLRGTLSAERLSEAWTVRRNLDPDLIPTLPSKETTLRRAMREVSAPRTLVRPIGKGSTWAVVEEHVNLGMDLEYHEVCRASLGAADDLVLRGPEAYGHIGDCIRAAYAATAGQYSQNDVSGWLVDLVMKEVHAVALRDTGGIYFVPRPLLPLWKEMAAAVKEASDHQLFEVPALRSDEAVEAILDAINHEAEVEAKAVEDAIQEGELGKRALRTKKERCMAMASKVEEYEHLLGRRMTSLHERLETLQASVAEAILAASTDEQP